MVQKWGLEITKWNIIILLVKFNLQKQTYFYWKWVKSLHSTTQAIVSILGQVSINPLQSPTCRDVLNWQQSARWKELKHTRWGMNFKTCLKLASTSYHVIPLPFYLPLNFFVFYESLWERRRCAFAPVSCCLHQKKRRLWPERQESSASNFLVCVILKQCFKQNLSFSICRSISEHCNHFGNKGIFSMKRASTV